MTLATTLGLLALAAVYAPVLAELVRAWRTDTYAVHGTFVPLFSAFLLWADRDRLRVVPAARDAAGRAVVLAGLGLLALGHWQASLVLKGLSAVVVVAGALLWARGARYLRRAWFPVAFLALMVPLPRVVVDVVSRPLQLFATAFAASLVDLLGIPVYRRGVLIEMPTVTLEIAEICNGLRFLMALLVLTIAFAQLSQRSRARKLVLVAVAIPLGILANAIRVTALVLTVDRLGPEAAQGVIHHSIGKGVWALALVPLLLLGFALRRGGGGGPPARTTARRPSADPMVPSSLPEGL